MLYKIAELLGLFILVGFVLVFIGLDVHALLAGSIGYGGKYGPWRHALRASEPTTFWRYFIIYLLAALAFSGIVYQSIREKRR
jgi:hypothetical protein